MSKKPDFEPLILKNKSIQEKSSKGYKIYKDEKEFVLIEAETAAQAIETSGITTPFKIEKSGMVGKHLFLEEELLEIQKSGNLET